MFFVFVFITLVPSHCNHLDEGERASGFACIVFRMFYYYKYSAALSLMAPWVGLQFVIVVFPDHTH